MRKILIAAALLLATPTILAGDGYVARLVGMTGSVLVSNDFTIASASEAVRLKPGMRVLVTLNSAVTVEYANGCRVRLGAGERLEVREEPRCSARPASAVALAPVVAPRP
jgi:hypothetical protein